MSDERIEAEFGYVEVDGLDDGVISLTVNEDSGFGAAVHLSPALARQVATALTAAAGEDR